MSYARIVEFGLSDPISSELVNGQDLTLDIRKHLVKIQSGLTDILFAHRDELDRIIRDSTIVLNEKNVRAQASIDKSLAAVSALESGTDFRALVAADAKARSALEKARSDLKNSISEIRGAELRGVIRALDENSRSMLLVEGPGANDPDLLAAIAGGSAFETLIPESILSDSIDRWLRENRGSVVADFELSDRLLRVARFNVSEIREGLAEPLGLMSGNRLGAPGQWQQPAVSLGAV